MLDRKCRRLLANVALLAGMNTATGCASTHRFLVDPGVTSHFTIEAIVTGNERTLRFGPAGGFYDPRARTIRGNDREGDPIETPLAKVSRVWFRPVEGEHRERVAGNLKPLQKGVAWRPDGRAQFVVKTSGEVLDLRKLPSRVDPSAQLVNYTPRSGPPINIPFSDIAYLQIKDSHPGRTALCILGVAFVGLAIGVGISGGVGPDWGS